MQSAHFLSYLFIVLNSVYHLKTISQEYFLAALIPNEYTNHYMAHVHSWDGPLVKQCVDCVCHDTLAMMAWHQEIF